MDNPAILAAARQAWSQGRVREAQALIGGYRGTGPELAKARLLSGEIHRLIGDYHTALDHVDTCIAMLPEAGELAPILRGPAYFNRGVVLYHRDDLAGALQSFQAALVEFEAESYQDYRLRCLCNLAWVAAELGHVAEAEAAAAAAGEIVCTPAVAVLRQITRAYVDYAANRFQEALATCQEVLADPHLPPDVRSLACSVGAYTAVRLDQREPSEHLSQEAVLLALRTDIDPRIYSVARRARAFVTRMLMAQREKGA